MSQFHEANNSGALFYNERATEEKHPFVTGKATVDSKRYRVSIWRKVSKAGNEYFSMSLQPDESTGNERTAQGNPQRMERVRREEDRLRREYRQAESAADDMNDDLDIPW